MNTLAYDLSGLCLLPFRGKMVKAQSGVHTGTKHYSGSSSNQNANEGGEKTWQV
jgi:hypothetical protein